MPHDWKDLDHLLVTDEKWIEAPFEDVVETPREKSIREKQEKHFGGPMRAPPIKVIIFCESADPVPDLRDHDCPEEFADVVRHGRRVMSVKDRRVQNAPTVLRINRVRYMCRHCRVTFPEYLPDIHEEHRITKRFHRDLAVASLNRPFAEVARRNSVKPGIVETIFHEYRTAMMEDYQADLPEVLAVDETKLLGKVRFVCSDLKAGRIIDIVDDNRNDIEECFGSHSYRSNVQVFVQDMSAKYRSIAKDIFPHADIVVDRFHVIQRVTNSVDEARKAFTRYLPPHLRAALDQDIKLLVTNQSSLSLKRLQRSCPSMRWKFGVELERPSVRRPEVELL